MAVRKKPYFPLDLDSKVLDDGWVLPREPTFASGSGPILRAVPDVASQAGLRDVEDGWGISAATQPTDSTTTGNAKIDVNRATLEDLCAVPGIGPLRARRILSWRDSNGSFSAVSDLSVVRGLGKKSLAQLSDHLTV